MKPPKPLLVWPHYRMASTPSPRSLSISVSAHGRTLGDKLQLLAQTRPAALVEIEQIVDKLLLMGPSAR